MHRIHSAGVLNGASGRLVSFALAKASYEICVAMKMDYIFLCSRPPVDTMYRRYRFDDFLEGKKLDLHYAPGVPHTVLCLPVAGGGALAASQPGRVPLLHSDRTPRSGNRL